MAVGERGQRRHLGDHADRRHVALVLVVDVLRVGIEGGQRTDRGEQHAHRVGVVAEALHELLDVLVHEGVGRDVEHPRLELVLLGQLPEDQQVGDLQVAAVLAQLLDRDAAVPQLALVAVDPGDRAAAGGRVQERRVIRHQAEVVLGHLDLPQLGRADRAVLDRQLVLAAGALVRDAQDVAPARGYAVGLLGLDGLLGCHRGSLEDSLVVLNPAICGFRATDRLARRPRVGLSRRRATRAAPRRDA